MARFVTVDEYLAGASNWAGELRRLRDILNRTALTGTIKWNAPCYTWNGHNVVGIGAFKSYFGLWFFSGALLKDERGLLINAQPGKTRLQRQWRLTGPGDIKPTIIRSYVSESIALLKAGGPATAPRRRAAAALPIELRDALRTHTAARRAFDALSPARQREYAVHIAAAKRADTRERRAAAALPRILAGEGLHDRYRRKPG